MSGSQSAARGGGTTARGASPRTLLILGPCECHRCRVPVVYKNHYRSDIWPRWREVDTDAIHRCAA